MARTQYTIIATDSSVDARAAADACNVELASGGDTFSRQAAEAKIAECAPSLRDGLAVDAEVVAEEIEVLAIEDNGGGLHVAVLADGECTHWFSGFEHGGTGAPPMQDEIAGAATDGVDGWDGNAEDPAAAYAEYLASEYGYKLIGEWRSGGVVVHEDKMGRAGQRWARVETE